MELHEMDTVREVIEALVAEIGPDAVPEEIDVDGALALVSTEIADTDVDAFIEAVAEGGNDAQTEEGTDSQVEASAEVQAESTVA